MAPSDKIAVSLPAGLVRQIERERKRTGETRSAFVQRAIRLVFSEQDRRKRVAEYIEGYRNQPETEDEIAAAEAAGAKLLAQEPWE